MLGSNKTMRTALSHHQASRVDEAEALYRQILAANPAQPDALHLLGILASQQGGVKKAIELLERAVLSRADDTDMQINLAESYPVAACPMPSMPMARHWRSAPMTPEPTTIWASPWPP